MAITSIKFVVMRLKKGDFSESLDEVSEITPQDSQELAEAKIIELIGADDFIFSYGYDPKFIIQKVFRPDFTALNILRS